MKTDRKLLELAAKAAGIELGDDPHIVERVLSYWNPLRDDGDALRLAVALNLQIGIANDFQVEAYNDDFTCIEPCDAEQESYAATRRAIVRAAAMIGEAK